MSVQRVKTFQDGKFRYQLISGVKHYNFRDEAEFREFFGDDCPPLVRDWRSANQGDWVVADDGGVVQMLKVKRALSHPCDGKNYHYHDGWCRTVVGTFFINRNHEKFKMDTDWEKHISRYTFSGCPHDRESKTKLTPKEKQFVFAMVHGSYPMLPVEIYQRIYGSSRKTAIAGCYKLLRQERVMNELKKEVEEAAKELKLDHKWVLERLRMIAEDGEEEKNRLEAVKQVGRALQTFKVKANQLPPMSGGGLFMGFQRKQIEEVKNESGEVAPRKLAEVSPE